MGAKDSHATRAGESSTFTDFGFNNSGANLIFGPDFQADYWWGGGFSPPPYFLDSQKRGEALPVYINDRQLKILRDRSRRLCAENEFAIAALTNRKAYTFGSGFKYTVLPAGEHVSPDIVTAAQRVIDVFTRVNRMSAVELELSMRCDRDGEALIRLFPQQNGLLLIRWVEPEHLRAPSVSVEPAVSFGVETDPLDIMTVKGFWIVESPLLKGTEPVLVDAAKVVHFKCNADSGAKRGIPLFYPVEANLRRAEQIQAAMTSTATARAKIAMIRKMKGVARSAAERLKSEAETQTTIDPVNGQVTNVEQLRNNTILTSSDNLEYEWPKDAGMQGVPEILACELRSIAAMLVMPEQMLTANAGGAGGMAQLVAEAPATRNFEMRQQFFRTGIAEDHDSLLWRQLRHAVDCDILAEETLRQINLVAQPPPIIARDPDKAAAATKTYFDMGATSPQQVCAELGLNYEHIQMQRKEAGLLSPAEQAQAAMGMQPGADGAEQPQDGAAGAEGDQGPGEFTFDEAELN